MWHQNPQPCNQNIFSNWYSFPQSYFSCFSLSFLHPDSFYPFIPPLTPFLPPLVYYLLSPSSSPCLSAPSPATTLFPLRSNRGLSPFLPVFPISFLALPDDYFLQMAVAPGHHCASVLTTSQHT